MNFFFDTEFIEDGRTIDLISIGIASEDGRTLYLQNSECDCSKASDWVWRNVFPHLSHFDMRGRRACAAQQQYYDSGLGKKTITKCTPRVDSSGDCCHWATRMEIRDEVLTFVNVEKNGKPKFYGYYADYDWVVLCQLFGPMVALPKGFPMYCRDIKQIADDMGGVRIPKPDQEIHHALSDAIWIKEAHAFLMSLGRPTSVVAKSGS